MNMRAIKACWAGYYHHGSPTTTPPPNSETPPPPPKHPPPPHGDSAARKRPAPLPTFFPHAIMKRAHLVATPTNPRIIPKEQLFRRSAPEKSPKKSQIARHAAVEKRSNDKIMSPHHFLMTSYKYKYVFPDNILQIQIRLLWRCLKNTNTASHPSTVSSITPSSLSGSALWWGSAAR